MEQDTEVVPRIQVSSNLPIQRVTGTHINPDGGSLQAAPTEGRTNTNTDTAEKYRGQISGRRRYFSVSEETTGRRQNTLRHG